MHAQIGEQTCKHMIFSGVFLFCYAKKIVMLILLFKFVYFAVVCNMILTLTSYNGMVSSSLALNIVEFVFTGNCLTHCSKIHKELLVYLCVAF